MIQNTPLAERLRPTSLKELIGQEHLKGILQRAINSGSVPSMILWGPPGIGKTTIAKQFKAIGIPIYIADDEAKALMSRSKVIQRKLIELFGTQAYVNNKLNKSFLADAIFTNASLLKKMRAEVAHFAIDVAGELTDEDPKFYKNVQVTFKFYNKEFNKKKIEKAVDLSVNRYCGVMEMFRQFANVSVAIEYIEQ